MPEQLQPRTGGTSECRESSQTMPRCCCCRSSQLLPWGANTSGEASDCQIHTLVPCLLVFKPCRHKASALPLNYIPSPELCLSSYFCLLNFITCTHLFCMCELAHESRCECGGQQTCSLPLPFRLLDLDLMTGTFTCSVILPTPFFLYYFEEESH